MTDPCDVSGERFMSLTYNDLSSHVSRAPAGKDRSGN